MTRIDEAYNPDEERRAHREEFARLKAASEERSEGMKDHVLTLLVSAFLALGMLTAAVAVAGLIWILVA